MALTVGEFLARAAHSAPGLPIVHASLGESLRTVIRPSARMAVTEAMRVVLSAESFLPRVNGVANSVIHVARYLSSRDVPVLIVAADSYGPNEFEGMRVERMRSLVLPGVHEYDVVVASSSRCASIIEEFGASVVHLASPFVLGSRMQSAAHAVGVPTVAVYQTDVAGFASEYRVAPLARMADAVVRRIHASADINLVPSNACAAYLQRLGVRGSQLWGRGVDLETFDPIHRSSALRRDWARDGSTIVGFVGRLAPEKNVEILARLSGRSDVQVVIIGDGPSRAVLERAMPSARFLGRLTGRALGSAVASLDVLVAPGEHETFCQVVQEAMASGVAVVAPAVGGPLDLIDHGVDGMHYPPGDSAAMADAVVALGADPGLRAALVSAALRKVRSRTWRALGDELYTHYVAATGKRGVLTAA